MRGGCYIKYRAKQNDISGVRIMPDVFRHPQHSDWVAHHNRGGAFDGVGNGIIKTLAYFQKQAELFFRHAGTGV